MKNKVSNVGILGVLFGVFMNRILVSKYGDMGSVMLASVALTIMLIAFLGIIFMKKYVAALVFLPVVVPGTVMFVGIIIDNWIMMIGGLLLLMVGLLIMIKILPKLIEKQKEK